MNNIPVLNALKKYIDEGNAPFSMPGHKNGRGFTCTDEGRVFNEVMLKGDITEVEGLDNLHNPQGIIKEAQELLAKLYGSRASYFLVNGSTSGNLAMIFSAFKEGDKVLVERNCHRSIFNGIIMRKLQPIYIKNYMSKRYNAPISIDMGHFLQTLEENSDINGVILTYPNYYGIACDLSLVVKKCKERGIKVLVDCAHGAHFGISPLLPDNPIKLGADMAVMSAHKTLPSLTQTAYLHIGETMDKSLTDFYVSMFSSTSPSYTFMASMDYARYYLETYGREAFDSLVKTVDDYRDRINQIKGLHVISQGDIKSEYAESPVGFDRTRLIINVDKEYNGFALLDYLRLKGVQSEMSDGFNTVLISSPFNSKEDFERLFMALKHFPMSDYKRKPIDIKVSTIPSRALLPWQAVESKSALVDLKDCEGKISGTNIVPYPPGVPIIMMGEFIDRDVISMVQYYLSNGVTILGIDEEKIRVIEQ
ncbi:aminotransferase class I/II-fold pyridoxal phosphate-dependent enzyme [Clostridium thermarum]|uniref:aminotransferase class I/II-fold pyridoxal phosphate-dependent enzyme n=1 Tax=Clostridium thermarum TaxID=1716543 RepID=UPI0013CF5515|nr:aminotransferase class I/II-fold pyridoxal phosphate-dependent enzyme [Clostridium thermarum]